MTRAEQVAEQLEGALKELKRLAMVQAEDAQSFLNDANERAERAEAELKALREGK